MKMFSYFYNHDIAILFIGGLCAWFLAATIDSIKHIKRSRGGGKYSSPGEKTSAIKDVLLLPDLRKTLVNSGIQPLLIVTFVNLLEEPSELNIIGVFFLVIFIMFHAFYLSDKYSGKLFYQLIILFLWGTYYFLISYSANHL